jgi:hypothetical protein
LLAALVAAVGARAGSSDDAATVHALLLASSDLPAGFKDNGSTPSNRCFSPVAPGMTVQAESHQYEKDTGSTDTVVQSASALYGSHAEAAGAFQKLYGSKTAPTCVYASFTKQLPKNEKASNLRLIPIKTTIGTLRVVVWDINFRLTRGTNTAPVEIAVTGYLRGRAMTQLLFAVVGTSPATENIAKAVSASLTIKLRRAPV